MNFLLRILAVGSLLTAAHSFAAGAFEGKLTMTVTGEKGRTQDINMSMKGKKQRLDITADRHSVTMIMDLEKLEMLMLVSEQQTYMVMPIKQVVDKAVEKGNDRAAKVDIERTGKTDKILGYTCEQLVIKDTEKGSVTEVWIASGLGTFMGLGGNNPMGGRRGGAAAAKWEEALKGTSGFPLRMVTQDADGKPASKMEVTQIQPGSLPDSLFTPPEGYRKFDLGALNPFRQN